MTQFRALIADASDAGHAISVAERAALLGLNMPSNLPPDQVNAFLDRWNRTVEYNSQGIVDTGDLPPEWSADFIARDTFIELWERARDGVAASTADGFPNLLNGLFYAFNVLIADRSEVGEGVCARVRIQIDQTATVARSAFRATLEINNDGSDPLEAIDVDVQVLDDQGADATSRFGIFPPDLVGLSDVDGGGSIPGGGHSGSASWLIVPMDAAAPDGPRHYRVGGTFGYYLAGNYIQVVLQPTEITVLRSNRRAHSLSGCW
ncbi:MAG: hypothetical protein HZB38_11275 [Planctomycetes bacterium]|nr:hypothetical protein [Planctomycetota bacterium]